MIRHPFKWLDENRWGKTFIVLLILTLSLTCALTILGRPLKTAAAPLGILSFEFAGDLPTAISIIESWDDSARVFAGLNLGLDYLYLFAYPCSIGLGCLLVARRFRTMIAPAQLGRFLAWAQIFAGLFDAIENYALIRLLTGSQHAAWPAIAYWCATPKFIFVLLGIAYVLLGALASVFVKRD